MDPNLHFRNFIPPWVGVTVGLLIRWSFVGFRELLPSSGLRSDTALLTFVGALLASPALGAILNAFVIAWCSLFRTGPENAHLFEVFRAKVRNSVRNDPQTVRILDGMRASAVVAAFEYRTDPKELIEWRRRHRAAFFADWACILAILGGVFAALQFAALSYLPQALYTCGILFVLAYSVYVITYAAGRPKLPDGPRHDGEQTVSAIRKFVLGFRDYVHGFRKLGLGLRNRRDMVWQYVTLAAAPIAALISLLCWSGCPFETPGQWAAIVFTGLLVIAYAYNAARSEGSPEEEQRLWVEACTPDAVKRLFLKYASEFAGPETRRSIRRVSRSLRGNRYP